MFTNQELVILLQLVRQANAETSAGKIMIGQLLGKLEKMVEEANQPEETPA